MLCTNCDTRNDDNARFCRACGTAFAAAPTTVLADAPAAPTCPACRNLNPAGARYCVYCATPIAAGTPPASPAPVTRSWWPAPAPAPVPMSAPGFYAAPAAAPGPQNAPGFYAAPANAVATNNVTVVNYAPPQLVQIGIAGSGADLLMRAIWFFFIGWWLGLIWTIAAWLFNLTLIGLPVGAMMLNAIPQVMTLRRPRSNLVQAGAAGPLLVVRPPQQPLPLRAIWFVLVGWWASLLWMMLAWAFSATLVLMPIGFWMFNRVPTITTLQAES